MKQEKKIAYQQIFTHSIESESSNTLRWIYISINLLDVTRITPL
jgi:hypothetical protein